MNCKNCGTTNALDAKYCGNCGSALNTAMNVEQAIQSGNEVSINNNYEKKNKSKVGLIIIIIAIILILIFLFLGVKATVGYIYNKITDIPKYEINLNKNDESSNEKVENNNNNNTLNENLEFITKFDNFELDIEMNISVSNINTKMVSKGTLDQKNQKEYLENKITTMGITITNKIYQDYGAGYSYMTIPYGGNVWYKERSTSQLVDLNEILNKLINMENVTKVSENHYKVKMTKEDVEGLMTSGEANISDIFGDIYVDVYTENGYITKLEYNFSDIIKGFDEFTAIIKFSNYNNAGDVEIPQSVINSAKSK